MKQNLLLLHGALGTKNQFKALKEKLSNDFEVHAFDFEGHGEQESVKDFTMKLFVENVIQYTRENEIKQTHIFGYSMGGYVGLNIALEFPKLVGKIITLGTKFNWTKEIAENEIRMLNPDKIEEKVPKFANKLASIHVNNNWKTVVEKTARMMYGLGNGEKLTSKDLKRINHKVLISVGDKDRTVSIEESKESSEILMHGKLTVISNLPHSIEEVNKQELNSIILDFLKN